MGSVVEHVERLLLQHDCVIIPEFGGFVLQAVPAVYDSGEHLFSPAGREIVFNPTLTHNDGLLIESFMHSDAAGFEHCQQTVRRAVTEMKSTLDDTSELQFGEIGSFVKEADRMIFKPVRESGEMFCADSYGLPTFHVLPIAAYQQPEAPEPHEKPKPETPVTGTDGSKETRKDSGKYIRMALKTAAAIAAAVVLFLLMSIPVKEVDRTSYSASFVPQEILMGIGYGGAEDAAASKPDDGYVAEPAPQPEAAKPEEKPAEKTADDAPATDKVADRTKKAVAAPAAKAKTEKAATPKQQKAGATGKNEAGYYVIVASFETRDQANSYLKRQKGAEMADAGIIVCDGRVRVYSQHFQTKTAAVSHMNDLRQKPKHSQAWVYRMR